MGNRGLANAAIILAAVALLSKLAGFIRELVLANFFGTTQAMDAFIVAYTVPDIFGTLVRLGIIAAFIPVYSGYLTTSPAKAESLANSLVVIVLAVLAVVAAVGFFLAEPVIGLMAPGFSPEVRDLSVSLARITLPIVIIAGVVGILSGIQQAHQVFLYPALAAPVWSFTIIAVVWLLSAQAGIYAAAYAVVAAAMMQLVVQCPGLGRCNYKLPRNIDLSQEGIGRVAVMVIPVLTGIAANHLSLFIDRIFASSLTTGSISALNYAVQVNNVFIGLFITPLTTVLYPTLARLFAEGNVEAYKGYINTSVRMIAFMITPIMLFMIVFRRSIVEVLFHRGAFDSQAVEMTASALMFFAVGMLGMALLELLNQSFFARQSTRAPVLVSGGILLVNVGLNFILVGPFAHGGLALATSIAVSLGAVALIHMLRRSVGSINGRQIAGSIAKIALAAGSMIIAGYLSHELISACLRPSLAGWWATAWTLVGTASVCMLVYISAAFFLRSEELAMAVTLLAAKMPGTRLGRRLGVGRI